MRLFLHNMMFVPLCLTISRSTEYAEIGDNMITYFRGSPFSRGVKNILRLGSETGESDASGDRSSRSADDFYKHSYKRRKPVYRYVFSMKKRPLLEYEKDIALKRSIHDMMDLKRAPDKTRIMKNSKAKEHLREFGFPRVDEGAADPARLHMNPFLNILKSRQYRSLRRQDESDSETGDLNWKDEWKRIWLYKKYEAVNGTRPIGDSVAMVAARPWGVQCGDPNQHDMLWGNCMLDAECEAEFRIYRGDFFCGRTKFVCCGLQVTTYDLNQGIDISFDDKSLSTDSAEKREADKGDKNKNNNKNKRDKKKRQTERENRKNKIKKNISKIVREIRKILNRVYKNGTRERQRKTKILKQFVKQLKEQYKKDRESIKEIHEEKLLMIDTALMKRLNQIRAMNEHFMNNKTFAEIVITGKVSQTGVKMLMEAYPELSAYFMRRRSKANERSRMGRKRRLKDYLDYDIDYGFMYN